MSQEEDRTRHAVDSEPKHYQRAIPAPDLYLSCITYDRKRGVATKLSIVDADPSDGE